MPVKSNCLTYTTIMERLKTTTKPLHEQVERSVDLMRQFQSIESYTALLAKFYGLYVPLEYALVDLFQSKECSDLISRRLKADWIHADLLSLGYTPAGLSSIPICQTLPLLKTVGEGWGALYVMEGATLGGQVIQREAVRALQLSADHGCAFFAGYGAQTPIMWREFGEALTEFTREHPEVDDEIVAGAVATFQTFQRWMA